ncbi:MAG TPA: hypothetical protein PLC24_09425 [Myxococcota bacterium]|nr:hypothetical protein [Myxococcota bacterium]
MNEPPSMGTQSIMGRAESEAPPAREVEPVLPEPSEGAAPDDGDSGSEDLCPEDAVTDVLPVSCRPAVESFSGPVERSMARKASIPIRTATAIPIATNRGVLELPAGRGVLIIASRTSGPGLGEGRGEGLGEGLGWRSVRTGGFNGRTAGADVACPGAIEPVDAFPRIDPRSIPMCVLSAENSRPMNEDGSGALVRD